MEAGLSEDHLGVLDEVVPVSSLDNAVDPGVESGQFGEGVFNVSASLGVGGEVGSFLGEEVGSKSFVSVAENSVSVVAELLQLDTKLYVLSSQGEPASIITPSKAFDAPGATKQFNPERSTFASPPIELVLKLNQIVLSNP